MRLCRCGERTWLIMLPAALGLAIGLFVYADSRQAKPSLSFVGLAIADGDGRAGVYQATGFYSPSHFVATVSTSTPLAWLSPLAGGNTMERRQLLQSDGMTWPQLTIERDSAVTFLAGSVIDLPRSDFDLSFGPEGLSGTITNRLGQDLTDAVLLMRGRAFAIGTLANEKPVPVTIAANQRLGVGEYIPVGFANLEDRWHNELIAGLVCPPKSAAISSLMDEEPYLLGWVEKPMLSPGADMASAGGKGMMLIAQRLTFSPSPSGAAVKIPDQMLLKSYRPIGTEVWNSQIKFQPSSRAGGVEVRISAPPSVGKVSGSKVTVGVSLTALDWRLSIQGVRPDGGTEQLDSVDNPSGMTTIQIDGADRFLSDGAVTLRLAVDPLQSSAAKPAGPGMAHRPNVYTGAAANQWAFDDVDITLQGTVQ